MTTLNNIYNLCVEAKAKSKLVKRKTRKKRKKSHDNMTGDTPKTPNPFGAQKGTTNMGAGAHRDKKKYNRNKNKKYSDM